MVEQSFKAYYISYIFSYKKQSHGSIQSLQGGSDPQGPSAL